MIKRLVTRSRLVLMLATMALVSLMVAGSASAATDWTAMTSALTTEFDAAKVVILPVAGGILALFLGYKVIKRFT